MLGLDRYYPVESRPTLEELEDGWREEWRRAHVCYECDAIEDGGLTCGRLCLECSVYARLAPGPICPWDAEVRS